MQFPNKYIYILCTVYRYISLSLSLFSTDLQEIYLKKKLHDWCPTKCLKEWSNLLNHLKSSHQNWCNRQTHRGVFHLMQFQVDRFFNRKTNSNLQGTNPRKGKSSSNVLLLGIFGDIIVPRRVLIQPLLYPATIRAVLLFVAIDDPLLWI